MNQPVIVQPASARGVGVRHTRHAGHAHNIKKMTWPAPPAASVCSCVWS